MDSYELPFKPLFFEGWAPDIAEVTQTFLKVGPLNGWVLFLVLLCHPKRGNPTKTLPSNSNMFLS